jgi:hypothetical protein
MNKLLTSGALACAALAFSAPAALAQLPVAKPDPKLVVVISVDQFSANLFAQHRTEFIGGLGAMAREGIVYPNGYQSHAMTETCPGHSTLLTGKHPNKTGISANDWYDRETGKQVYCLGDDQSPLANDPKGRAVSAKNMVATTYGDWLKAVSPPAACSASRARIAARSPCPATRPTAHTGMCPASASPPSCRRGRPPRRG